MPGALGRTAAFGLTGASHGAWSGFSMLTCGAFSSGNQDAWTNASVFGGIRLTSLTIVNNPLGGDAKTRVITTPGILEVSSDSDVDTNMLLAYGVASNSFIVGSNSLNLDFTGTPIVEVAFRSNDIAQPVTVWLYNNDGAQILTRTLNIAAGITPSSPMTYGFDFTSDIANLGDIDAIAFTFDPAPGGDFALTGINTVPEPMSIAVLSVGALALLRRRKK